MKKILALLLIIMTVVTFMPAIALAGTSYDRIILEMEFGDGHMENRCDYWSGESQSISFVKAYWNGDNIIKKEYISDASALSVETIFGPKGKLTLSKKDNNHFKISLDSSVSEEAKYCINYIGKDKNKFSESAILIRGHSAKHRDFINKVKYNNFNVTASSKGNTITWTPSITSTKPDNYLIYRSTSKNKGYKQIDCVDGKTKKYLDNDGIKKGKTYYYKVRAKIEFSYGTEYSKYSAVKSVKAKKTFKKETVESLNKATFDSYDKGMLQYATIFGLPEDIHYIENPKTDMELVNNIAYACLLGDFELNFALPTIADERKLKDQFMKAYRICYNLYPDLAGAYMNAGLKGDWQYEITYVGSIPKFRMYLSTVDSEKVFGERQRALEAAEQFVDTMHSSGKIKDDMRDMDIIKAYFVAVKNYANVPTDEETFNNPDYNFDTAYGFFIDRYCNCGGRAAGICQLLRIEGIKVCGVHCIGHIFPLVCIDGVIYTYDAGNQIPIDTIDGAIKKNTFGGFDDSLDFAKEYFGLTKNAKFGEHTE